MADKSICDGADDADVADAIPESYDYNDNDDDTAEEQDENNDHQGSGIRIRTTGRIPMFNPVLMKMMTTMKRQALKLSKKQNKSTTPGKVRQMLISSTASKMSPQWKILRRGHRA